MRVLWTVVVIGLFTGFCLAADDGAAKKDLAKLQGTWNVVKAVKDGQSAPVEAIRSMQVVIKGDLLTFKEAGQEDTVRFTLDPAQMPPAIDFKNEKEKATFLGVYEIGKERVTFCLGGGGKARPRELDAKKGAMTSLMVLERAKP